MVSKVVNYVLMFIAQWLERTTGNLDGHEFDFRWGTQKIRFENASSFIQDHTELFEY